MDENQFQYTPEGALDPVLVGQGLGQTLTDPLIRELYFGSADQPGFYNQLLSVGQDIRGGLSGGLGMYMPFLQRSEQYGDMAYAPITDQDISQFYDPYEDRVVQQTIDDLVEQAGMQDISRRAQSLGIAGEGAFGSRGKLLETESAEALGRGLGEAVSGIRSRGFRDAMGDAFRQRNLFGQGAQFQQGLAQLYPQYYYQDLYRPLGLMQGLAGLLPGYTQATGQLTSSYGVPKDPKAVGLGSALALYSGFKNPRSDRDQYV